MKTIILKNEDLDKELSINVFTTWNEITLKTYFNLQELEESNKEDQVNYILSLIELISNAKRNELLDFSMIELNKIVETFQSIGEINTNDIKDFFIIDSTIYVPKKNMTNITTAETIYIKQMQEVSKTDKEISLSILSILLRPGYKKEVNGIEKYIQHPLDEEGIQLRKQLFLEKLSINDVLPLLSFFLSGMQK